MVGFGFGIEVRSVPRRIAGLLGLNKAALASFTESSQLRRTI